MQRGHERARAGETKLGGEDQLNRVDCLRSGVVKTESTISAFPFDETTVPRIFSSLTRFPLCRPTPESLSLSI